MSQVTEEQLKNMSPQEIAEMQKKNCIFCKIISGEIPSKKVYEDDDFFAILDINPASKGHVLLMPKEHVQLLPQMQPENVGKLGITCKKISQKILQATGAKGTSIFIANGPIAGQKAPHFIIHIIPRKDNDDLPLNPDFTEIDEKKHAEIHNKLRSAIYGGNPPPQTSTPQETEEQETNEEEPKEEPTETEESEEITEEQEEPKEEKTQDDKNEEEDETSDLDLVSNLFK